MSEPLKDFQKKYLEKKNRLREIVDDFMSKMAGLRKRKTELLKKAAERKQREQIEQVRKSLDES